MSFLGLSFLASRKLDQEKFCISAGYLFQFHLCFFYGNFPIRGLHWLGVVLGDGKKKKTHIIFPWLNHRLENILAVCTCTCQVKCQNNLHTNNSQDDQIQMQSYKAVKKSSKQFTEQKFEAQVETVTSCFSFDSLCALMQREDAFLRALTRIQKVRTQPAGRTRHGRCSPRKHGLFRHGLDQ